MGDNGSGKTTLLRCLAGIAQTDAGELLWHGEPAGASPELSRMLGMVAHESQLYPNLTLQENLLFAARMTRVRQPANQVSDWLERIGLSAFANSLPGEISHGMRRRVSVARGLIHKPRLVLMDEPFSGLDTEGQIWLAELLNSLQLQHQSICFTTHDIKHAQTCSDRVLVLKNGLLLKKSCPTLLENDPHKHHQAA